MRKVKSKKLQPKRFYLSFELYSTPSGRPRVNAGFVPTTERSLPDINTEFDKREYGIKIDDKETHDAYNKVSDAVEEFAKFLISVGEIEKGEK